MRTSTLTLLILLSTLLAILLKLRQHSTILQSALYAEISKGLNHTSSAPLAPPTPDQLLMSSKSKPLLDALALRRSYYGLNSSSPISPTQIRSIIQQSLETVPSAFNSRTTRIVLLLGEEHKKLWKMNAEIVKAAKDKMGQFEKGCGTVLFFEDQKVVEIFKSKYEIYKEQFGPWSHHTSGMHQLAIWTALETEGFGANLQHYNPLIDDGVKEAWKLPADWKLIAQMVFGTPTSPPADKKMEHASEVPMDEKFRVYE